jgi:hypothetical protein
MPADEMLIQLYLMAEKKGLQNLYSAVRSRPAPPIRGDDGASFFCRNLPPLLAHSTRIRAPLNAGVPRTISGSLVTIWRTQDNRFELGFRFQSLANARRTTAGSFAITVR